MYTYIHTYRHKYIPTHIHRAKRNHTYTNSYKCETDQNSRSTLSESAGQATHENDPEGKFQHLDKKTDSLFLCRSLCVCLLVSPSVLSPCLKAKNSGRGHAWLNGDHPILRWKSPLHWFTGSMRSINAANVGHRGSVVSALSCVRKVADPNPTLAAT